MHNATIKELWVFPVKACQGIRVKSIYVDKSGVKGDRDFAFWANGKIIDQKCTPKLAAISASLNEDQSVLTLENESSGKFEHSIERSGRKLDTAQVLDKFQSIDQGDAVARWASQIVGKEVRLVIPGDSWTIKLPVPCLEDMHHQDKKKFFAVSSVSLTNMASLNDYNSRLEIPVGSDRFRSNIVVEGMDAWEEDRMGVIYTDHVELKHMSGAERCVIITTDQRTGERPDNNMLQALKEFRLRPREDRFASGLLFGSYMSVSRGGVLNVGDVFQHGAPSQRPDRTTPANASRSNGVESSVDCELAGRWQLTIRDTPLGDQVRDLEFILEEGRVCGQVAESDAKHAELEDCELSGDELSFTYEITEPVELPLMFSLRIDGDQMSGTVKLGALGDCEARAVKI